jgi:hypothetical protein
VYGRPEGQERDQQKYKDGAGNDQQGFPVMEAPGEKYAIEQKEGTYSKTKVHAHPHVVAMVFYIDGALPFVGAVRLLCDLIRIVC